MNEFEKAIERGTTCDICGEPMFPCRGNGWDNDRMLCSDIISCGAEIVYPTSTDYSAVEDSVATKRERGRERKKKLPEP